MFRRRLLKRSHSLIDIERNRRPAVPQPAGELDSQHALLMPESRATVTEQMGVDAADTAHGVAEGRAFDTLQWLQRWKDPALDWDPATTSRFGDLRPHTNTLPDFVHISILHRYCFPDSHPSVFYEDNRQSIAFVQWRDHGEDLVRIGGFWYLAQRLGQSNGDVAGWVLWERVKDHPELADIEAHRGRLEAAGLHVDDPFNDFGRRQ